MTSERNECFDEVVRAYVALTTKFQKAEAENARLKSELLTLSEKLADADNEIGRMSMVLKHRAKDMQSERQFGRQIEWSNFVAHHH